MRRIACVLVLAMAGLCGWICARHVRAAKLAVQRESERLRGERAAEGQAIIQAVQRYTAEKGKPPRTLEDLVDGGYLKTMPEGPSPSLTPNFDTPIPAVPGHPNTVPAS